MISERLRPGQQVWELLGHPLFGHEFAVMWEVMITAVRLSINWPGFNRFPFPSSSPTTKPWNCVTAFVWLSFNWLFGGCWGCYGCCFAGFALTRQSIISLQLLLFPLSSTSTAACIAPDESTVPEARQFSGLLWGTGAETALTPEATGAPH